MTKIVRVPVAPLTEEAFAPFGTVLAARERAPDFTGISSAGWKADFDSASTPEVMVFRSRYAGLRFSVLEQHREVTQTFIPLGRVPAVVAVAAPGDDDEAPDPASVRGFLLDGSAGYVLKRETWHSPDRYPLYPPAADVVIITDHETQRELETVEQGLWKRTRAVDYDESFGVVFEFEL